MTTPAGVSFNIESGGLKINRAGSTSPTLYNSNTGPNYPLLQAPSLALPPPPSAPHVIWYPARDHHDSLRQLEPLVEFRVKPDYAGGVASVEVAVVTVLVPPAGVVELGAVGRADVMVAVERAERHQVGVAVGETNTTQVLTYKLNS